MKPNYIIIHHSASPQNQTAQSIDNYHRQKWNFKSELGHYAGYQYIIEKDGNIFQARKDTEVGAHCKEYSMNYKSIGICVVGWYDDGHDNLPTKAQQESLGKLLREKMAEHDIPRERVDFHRHYATYKSCPGYHITDEFITNLIEEDMKKEFVDAVEYATGKKYGDNINDKEQKDASKRLIELKDEKERLEDVEADYFSFKEETKRNVENYETRIANQSEMLKVKDEKIGKQKDILKERAKETKGELVNTFDLGRWRIIIKDIKNG